VVIVILNSTYGIPMLLSVAGVAEVVLIAHINRDNVVEALGRYQICPDTSQSPAVRDIDVTLAVTFDVKDTALPSGITEEITSPTLPTAALSLVVVPIIPEVLLKLKLVADAAPNIGVTRAGDVAKTNAPDPVSSDITPFNSKEVVAAKADNLLAVYATVPPAPNTTDEPSVPVNVRVFETDNVLALVIVKTPVEDVIVNPLIEVAVATPNVGVVKAGEVRVLFVRVSEPASVAKVPETGSVIEVAAVAVNVIPKAPNVVNAEAVLKAPEVLKAPVTENVLLVLKVPPMITVYPLIPTAEEDIDKADAVPSPSETALNVPSTPALLLLTCSKSLYVLSTVRPNNAAILI
jgi:hypothetical protein